MVNVENMGGEGEGKSWVGRGRWLTRNEINRSLLVELPQPGDGVAVPGNASVVANCNAYLERGAARGDRSTRNGERRFLLFACW